MLKNRFLEMQTYLDRDGIGHRVKKQKREQAVQQSIVRFSRSLYDTGEHVLTGEILDKPITQNKFNVNGVEFTYGEIITMGDFFETVDDFLAAPKFQLSALRLMIQKSRDFYDRKINQGKKEKEPDIDWSSVIPAFYDLAERNDSHFSVYDAAIYPGLSQTKQLDNYFHAYEVKQTNKGEWEQYHARALDMAKKANNSTGQLNAYVVNAFGDHFLTDAFSAGHLFNKSVINKMFQDKFYTNGKLKDISKGFFQKVADKVLADGPTNKLFSKYEVTDAYGVNLLFGTYNPNLDTNNRLVKTFKELLIGIAERKDAKINGPDLVGNTMIAKVLHDILNRQQPGVEVTNRKKDATWNLTGDGTLNKKNIEMIQKAVKESISNIEFAPSGSSTNAEYFKKVWDYTPVPTANGIQTIHRLIEATTQPQSDVLVFNTAQLVINNRDTLIKKLKDFGIIQEDK